MRGWNGRSSHDFESVDRLFASSGYPRRERWGSVAASIFPGAAAVLQPLDRDRLRAEFVAAKPFPYVKIDNFL